MRLPLWSSGPRGAAAATLGAVLALGLALRLALAYVLFPDSGFWLDPQVFASWALSLAYHGPGPYYESAGFADYPPGFLLVLWPLGLLSLQLAPDDPSMIRLLIKLPAILADSALAVAAYLIVRREAGNRAALAAATLYTLNPITWFDSAIWGQVDSLGTLVLLMAVLSLGARFSEASALLGVVAILIKPQYIIVAPVIGLVLIRRHVFRRSGDRAAPGDLGGSFRWLWSLSGPARLATSAIVGLAPAWAVLALFRQTPTEFLEHMRKTADQYPYLSVNAFNPWAVFSLASSAPITRALEAIPWLYDGGPMAYPPEAIPWLNDGAQILGGATPYSIGLVLFAAATVFATARLLRRNDPIALLVCMSALALALFDLPTRIHERYLFPFFALALPLAATSRRWLAAYTVLAAASFANMYAVYSLPLLQNAGSYRPELLEITLFSPPGIVAISMIHIGGLLWVFWELVRLTRPGVTGRGQSATAAAQQRTEPLWGLGGQGGSENTGDAGGELAGSGELSSRLGITAKGRVRQTQLKPRVRVPRSEIDGAL